MQSILDDGEAQLLALAQATERVAESVDDPLTGARLRRIAHEIRDLARQDRDALAITSRRNHLL